jgi:hypothetical protein
MNPNPRAILTGALLAAGAAGIQAVLAALGCGPAGIVTSVAALLTTAITVLGPKMIDLRAEQQFGKDIRWLIEHNQGATSNPELATQLKEYHEKVLQAHVAAITAARADTKERKTRKSRRSSTATSQQTGRAAQGKTPLSHPANPGTTR